MNKRHYKYMTDREFRKLKNLIDGGLSIQLISEQTGRSRETLNRVAKVDSFQAYKDMVSAKNGTRSQTFPREDGRPGVRKPIEEMVEKKPSKDTPPHEPIFAPKIEVVTKTRAQIIASTIVKITITLCFTAVALALIWKEW